MSFSADRVIEDFEILGEKIHGKPLTYLDNAATTLKPKCVVEAVGQHYRLGASNVHRGVHFLSEQATLHYEDARETLRRFIGARHREEVIFTSGTTGSLNLLAFSLAKGLEAGDEVLISEMEHHSNIVPWQLIAESTGICIKKIPLTPEGDLDLAAYYDLLNPKTKIVAVTYVSNAFGTVNPINKVIQAAHDVGAKVVLDGAQAVAHMSVNVAELDCDFFALSGHKVFGPTGVGVLYGKKELLEEMPPAFGGGGMIRTVSFSETTFAEVPERFEAGTPHIAGAIGMAAAVKYLGELGLAEVQVYEDELTAYGFKALSSIPGVHIIGNPQKRASIFSFIIDGIHPHDVGTLLDQEGVAIRSGHHCCKPAMDFFKVPATSRASLAIYNTKKDIDRLCEAIEKAKEIFR